MLHRAPRLTVAKIDQLLRYFAKDLTATQAADLARVNRNTGNLWYNHFRELIAHSLRGQRRLSGKIEMDQAAFGHKGRKKKRSAKRHWTTRRPKKGEKQPPKETLVFGMYERKGQVYTHVVPDASRETLLPVIHMVVEPQSTLYSDEWRSFSVLKKDGYRHHKINHSRDFSRRGVNINGIEAFWSFAKRRLLKFNGLPAHVMALHIKECEWRYNNRKNVLPLLQAMLEVA